jgi:hypothetical protein
MQTQNFDKPLQRIFDKYEVTDMTFRALMEHAYEAGKKHAWGESTQEAVLFAEPLPAIFDLDFFKTQHKQAFAAPEVNQFPDIQNLWFDDIQPTGQEPTYELTQDEVNFLKPLLSQEVTDIQNLSKVWRRDASYYYEFCDKNEPLIAAIPFKRLNNAKNTLRGLKKKQKKLDALIRKLKYGKA